MTREEARAQYDSFLSSIGGYDQGDFDGLWNNASLDSGAYQGAEYQRSWGDVFGGWQQTARDRFQRQTASDGGVGGDLDPDGDGVVNVGGTYGRGTGAAITDAQLEELLRALEAMNSQPDVDLSHIQPGDFPVFEVPGENLSPAIDDTLLDMMEGWDPLGLEGYYADLLERTAGGGVNSERLFNRQEAARENLTSGLEAALGDLRGVLADRGLVSLPGAEEGSELMSTERAFLPLQRAYLEQLRESEFDESVRADEAEMSALERATGWQRDVIEQRLAGARSAQDRQRIMSEIALGVLDRNMEWNQFLAEFGLRREEVAAAIQQGRMDAIAPLMQMMLALLQQSRGGYIGN